MHSLLRNPVWHALTTTHQHFAIGGDLAKRYPDDITPFGAVENPNKASLDELASLTTSDEIIVLVGHEMIEEDENWKLIIKEEGFQMIHEGGELPLAQDVEVVTLGVSDVPEMLTLVELAQPGPLFQRAIELGKFFGVREGGTLVSMAGIRMALTGYREITAVATHPEYRGRGYSAAVVGRLIDWIHSDGNMPILHVKLDNISAIRLYKKLGFIHLSKIYFVVLQRK